MIPVTDATKRLEGTYGYVAAFDLADYEPNGNVLQIQVLGDDDVLSSPVESAVSPDVLDAYCEDEACPDIAFNQMGNTVNVFLKTTVYPYIAAVEVEFTYFRNAQNIENISGEDEDNIDIPQSAKELYKNVCLKLTYEGKGKRVPYDVLNNIRKQTNKLGL